MTLITIKDDFKGEGIQVESGDVIKVQSNVRWIYHKCCGCGLEHKWFIRAKKNRAIISKPYRED
jgi:hypothetical protein